MKKPSREELQNSFISAIDEAINRENSWSELGDYKFSFSESERAKRVYSQNKYILYHYTSFETAKKIIEGNSLKFSSPDEFNDPFDLNFDTFDFECDIDACVDFFSRMFPIMDKGEYKTRLARNVSIDPDFIKKNGIQMMLEIKENIGIACFSEEHDNALMWSHYADKHKGICLGINLGVSHPKKYSIMPVNYIKEAFKLNFYKHLNPDLHLMYLWIFYKSHIWSYEKEVRAICPDIQKLSDSHPNLIKFPKEDLKEIYIGLKTDDNASSELDMLLKKHGYDTENIRFNKMAINPKTYSFK